MRPEKAGRPGGAIEPLKKIPTAINNFYSSSFSENWLARKIHVWARSATLATRGSSSRPKESDTQGPSSKDAEALKARLLEFRVTGAEYYRPPMSPLPLVFF